MVTFPNNICRYLGIKLKKRNYLWCFGHFDKIQSKLLTGLHKLEGMMDGGDANSSAYKVFNSLVEIKVNSWREN